MQTLEGGKISPLKPPSVGMRKRFVLALAFSSALAAARVPVPDCGQLLAGRPLNEVANDLHGGSPLSPTPESRLGRYLADTGAATRVHRFRTNGELGPEKL